MLFDSLACQRKTYEFIRKTQLIDGRKIGAFKIKIRVRKVSI